MPPADLRRSPRPKRRAIARCARGWCVSRGVPRRIPTGGTRPCRRSAIRDAWLAIVGPRAGQARRQPHRAGRSPAIMRATCCTRRCSSSGWRGRVSRRSGRRAAADGRDHPQRGQMPAAGQQARAGRDRDLPQLFRGRAGPAAEGSRAGRAGPDRPRRRGASARPAALFHASSATVRSTSRPTAASSCRAITARATTRTRPPDAAMFESVFERACSLTLR